MSSKGTAWLYLAPAFIIILVFTVVPIIVSMGLSLFHFSLLSYNLDGTIMLPTFAGLTNFRRLMVDPYFWLALKNSLVYLLVVPVIQFVSFGVALLMDYQFPGRSIVRTVLYLPVVTSVVVVGIMWKWVLRSDGLLNLLLSQFGLGPVPWLVDGDIALFSIMLVTLWQGIGYYMVLYLGGLTSLNREVLEAAELDGAKGWKLWWYVLLPMMKPTIALCTILSTIAALKVFGEIFMMTGGGPESSTLTLVYYIFQLAFEEFRLGYASAVALLFGLIIALISYVNIRYFKEGGLDSYYG